jgi:hypothetical protein
VLDRAAVLMTAEGPRELEQATAELVGAETDRALHEIRRGLWFDRWFVEVASSALARVREYARGHDGAWRAPWRLLHGLAAIGPADLHDTAQAAISRVSKAVGKAEERDAHRREPAWLSQVPLVAATGQTWLMRDVHGSRLAVVAEFSYPGCVDSHVYLLDIDACGIPMIVGGGLHDDVTQAASAWQAWVGEAARGARPAAVERPDDLLCLVHCRDRLGGSVIGTETRALMDNWYRARRRIDDLAAALIRRGTPLPKAESLYRRVDPKPMATAFSDWYQDRHHVAPEWEVVETLVSEWLDGMLPGTEHAASPHRVGFQLSLISDWVKDPLTAAVQAIIPEWTRWLGEHAGIPDEFVARSCEVAAGRSRAPSECPGALL